MPWLSWSIPLPANDVLDETGTVLARRGDEGRKSKSEQVTAAEGVYPALGTGVHVE